MTTKTAISWTDYSSNPIKYRDREDGRTVWACVKKSGGCANCYSEALALRCYKGRAFNRPNIDKVEPFFDENEAKKLLSTRAIPSGSKVFVGDMTDVFGSWVPEATLVRLFSVFAARKDVTFQVLTKRPERAAALLSKVVFPYEVRRNGHLDWPLPNVWLGTSVEDQAAADSRIPHLLSVPAAVRFLSCEPLLGTVNIDPDWMMDLDWVIVGGESGPKHRPMDLNAFKSICAQVRVAGGVATYVKQDSGLYPGRQGRIPDDLWLHQWPESKAMVPA